MRANKRWVALVLTLALTIMSVGLSASASSVDNQFLAKINASRSANGLAPLSMSGSLQSYATSHSAKMADSNSIYHSTSAQLRAAAGSGWTKLGENVGRGPSVDSLHTAFMNSSGHRKNILGDYNYVGIGSVTGGDGYIYVTAVFMKKGSSSSSPTTTAPKSSGTTAPAKKSTTTTAAPTTTTLPPTTTTTLIVGPDKEITPGVDCIQATRFWQMCRD